MKLSIQNIFKNLKLHLFVLTFLTVLIALIQFLRHDSFNRIKQLEEQKTVVEKIYNLGRKDLDYSKISAQGLGNQLQASISSLSVEKQNDFLGSLIGVNAEIENQINELSKLSDNYITSASEYYGEKNDESVAHKLQEFSNSKILVTEAINELIIKDVDEDSKKFAFTQWIIYFTMFLSFIGTVWYAKRLSMILDDIKLLYAIGGEKNGEIIKTQEVDAINLRMIRKPTLSQNPSMIDPVTGIKNYKGMIQAYSEKKGLKESNYTVVCVFEIDNFKEHEKTLPKEFTQAVLKKVGFILSLYEQPTDVVARIEYCQFAVILSRDTQKKAFDECEDIRKNIEETSFKNPQGGTIPYTLSGGFIIKQANKSLEDSITFAKEVLQTAKEKGKNRIAQLRDHAEKF